MILVKIFQQGILYLPHRNIFKNVIKIVSLGIQYAAKQLIKEFIKLYL